MKSLRFVLITLFLAVMVPYATQLQFGDMLEFKRCGVVYSHYAVFIDDEPIPVPDNIRGPGQNIFEMTRNPSGCRFSTLAEDFHINNYLDHDKLHAQERQDIVEAIVHLMNGECGEWWLTNTCEHIATYVRYGEAHSQCNQPGTLVGPICRFFTYINQRRRARKEIRNPSGRESAAAA